MGAITVWGAFFLAGLIFSVFERASPARVVRYKDRILVDVRAFGIVFLYFTIVSISSGYLSESLLRSSAVDFLEVSGFFETPEIMRFILFFVLWDFMLYWVHRFMHIGVIWPIHRWHHSPSELWWLVGVRGSLPHIFVTFFPFLIFYLFGLPMEYGMAAAVVSVIGNAWMHVNINYTWMRYLEYVLITPRFHALHHINTKEFANVNFGSLLSIWDRMFGTFMDPDSVQKDKEYSFGIWDNPGFLKMIFGFK